MEMDTQEVLKGIKVADFTWVVVGPLTTRYLAAFGATVVKVESLQRAELLRTSRPFKDDKPGVNRSGYFSFLNANKYSMTINLNVPTGIEIAKRLVSWSDVVVENFVPGLMEKWGLGYEELREIKQDIIMLRTSNQGQTGPLARQPGLGPHLVGLSGLSHYSGWPDREPIGFGMAYTDMIAPPFAAAAIIAALEHRRRTGEGQFLDISQMETAIQFLSPQVLDYTVNNRVGGRIGNRCPYAAPHGAFPCSGENEWCAIAVLTQGQWERFGRVTNEPWATSDKFRTLKDRKENEDELEGRISEWTTNFRGKELMHLLQDAGIPAGVVQSNKEVLDDPQLRHRKSFWVLNHEALGAFPHLGEPLRLPLSPARAKMPAPCLGIHTELVCREMLGMSESEFDNFLIDGAFGL